MLSARSVTYAIGSLKLVEDISVEFSSGEFSVIMGQNGAGKSTLLKILAGSIRHFAGEVEMMDRSLGSFTDIELAKTRAVLSQHYDISFPISAEDIVLMGRYPYFKTAPAAADRKICSDALNMMGINNLAKRDYTTLSGGEAQKVQMARVLAQVWHDDGSGRKILYLDEPVSNLDLHYQHYILATAKEYSRNNMLVIAILHDINLAFTYADRVIFMKQGKIVKSYKTGEKIDTQVVSDVFDVQTDIIANPFTGKPLFIVR
jgi:iron complex transport system ATP-binding protein